MLQEPLQDQTVVSPTTATFTCSLKPGQPCADITWSRAGKPITPDGVKYVASLEGDVAKLEILNTTPEDTAEFEIKAENKVGMFTSMATLTVHGELYSLSTNFKLGEWVISHIHSHSCITHLQSFTLYLVFGIL